MITVKKLKETLEMLPDDAHIHAYTIGWWRWQEIGLTVYHGKRYWWITGFDHDKEDEKLSNQRQPLSIDDTENIGARERKG